MPSFPFLRLRSARRRSGGVVKSPGLAPFSLLAVLVVWACSDNAFTNVVDPRLTPKSIALSSSSVTFAALQESRQLNATVLNTGGDPIADATVSWTTSNAAVATVSSSGSVVAIANGTAQLTASSGTLQAQVSVTVAQVPVSGGLVPDSVMFTAAGDTVRLAVSGEDANGFAVQGGTWVWSVTDSSVATVSSEGLVTALESGVTTVRAGLQAFSATAVIEVDQRAASLTLSDDSVAFSAVGATRQLAATVMDSGGAAVSSPEISWSSSDAEIATVSDGGVVRSTGNGTATIFASLDGLAAAVTVTVAQVPASLMIAEDSVAFSSLEVTKGLEATVVDSLGSTMSLSLVTWSTSDTAVAAVSGSGEVTSKGDGSAVIYVESGGLVDSVLVSVVQIPVAAVMSVDSARIREIGKQVTLSAKVVDANDQPYIGGSEIVWSSTDEAVAPVRENADGEGEVTAIARGFAWIGVEVLGMDLSGSASIEVYLEGRVAFTQRDALTEEYALYVMDDDGRYVTQLTEMGAYNPRDPQWVSDGETVVFESGGALYSVDDGDGLFEESFAVTLAAQRSAGTYREVSWSSDGTRIAFTGDDGGIYVANADGSSEQQLVDPAVNGASGWPSWSPDGQFISFTSYRDGQGQLYVMESDGTGQMPLLPFVLRNRTNTDYDAVWSPANNGQVAFVSDREGDLNVYVYQPETATEVAMLTRLTPGNGDDRDPSWSPDGRALVYSSYSGSDDGRSAEVYRVAVDGAASERLTTNTNSDFEPVWGGGTWTSLSLVENAVAATITLSREEVMLASLNETQQLSGVVRNALGGLIAGSTLTWTSSDASVATVSATGLVTAIDNGTATITASTQGVSSTASVTVDQVAATVVLSPTAETFVSLTDTTQFSATVRDALGSTITGASVAWSSSDAAVATASSDGLVTAESNGSAVLSATSGSATGFAAITVGQVAATVVLSPTAETFVSLTDTTQFSATVQDALGVTMAGAAVTWASSATGVASVDAGGLVTSVADGSATLSATSGAASASAAITVGQEVVTVVLSQSEETFVSLTDTTQLVATAQDALGVAVAAAAVAWTSSDVAVATVSGSGLVTSVDNGATTVTATSGGVTADAAITVGQVAATVVLSPTAETFVSLTDTTQFSATVRDALGSTITGASVAWSSSDASVATVDSLGLVTAVVDGTTTVSATSASASAAAAITVGQVAATVVLSPTAETFVSLTDTTQFSATVQDALGVTMAGAAVTWASSATGVASVDAGGLVTSVADGSATLSATSGAASADAAITVGQVGARVVVSVDSARVRAIGEDIRISGQLVDALDVPVGGVHTYTWASTDPGVAVTSSAVTSDTVVVTGVAQGFTTIFGSTAGVDGSASIEVYLGGRIVVARRQGFSAEHRIFVMDEDGRYERQITDANGGASIDRYPGWRNEGRSITFVRDGDMYQASDMYEWMPDTLPTATLLATSPGGHGYRDAAWTLDGTQVVYTGSDQGIYKADFDGTNETQLVDPLADGLSGWPSWAPDASTIAFTSYRDGHAQIYEMNADGTGQGHILPLGLRALTVDTRAVYSPRNSNQIAFVSDRGIYDFAQGNLNVYIYDRGANLLAVPPVESDISATVLNPDSEGNFFLATAAPQDDRDVFWSFASYAPLTGSGGNRIVVVRYDTGSDDLSAELYSQCVTKGLICPEGRLTFNSVSDVEPAWSRRPLIDP